VSASRLLEELRALDVHVELDGDRLRVNAPAGVLTDDHKRDVAHRKSELIAFLREAQQLAAQQRAIVPLSPTGTRTPIFAVAGHNGDVFTYRVLAQHLSPDQPFYGLQPPGLDDGSAPLTRVEDLARYFAQQIRQFHPAGPMTIAGYCAGGTIAFELARQLSESGAQVSNLLLFGAPYSRSYRLPGQALAVVQEGVRRGTIHARAMRGATPRERVRYVADRVRRKLADREEKTTDPVLIRRAAVEKATIAAARAYSPQPARCHVDFVIPSRSFSRSWARPLRWSRLATSTCEFVGPDGCSNDMMLLPEHVAPFSAFAAEAQRRRR
jgi:thioesterase domain-containing protein